MKMLIVEDDPVSRLLLQRFLEPYGQAHVAINGEDAVATFRLAVEQRRPYDLVCLDVTMPGITGHEVLAEIRHIDGNKARTKVIMTTSRTDISSIEQAIRGRCDAYIIKPVSREALMNELRSLGLVRLKSLVAEDDPASRLLLQRSLEPYGEVHAAANGRDAVAMFRLAMTQREPYDLVCLDIMMPEMDGYEALEAIRHIEGKQSRAKIVMTTALAGAEDVRKAVQKQCDAYIIKPIRKEMLIDKLRSFNLI